jgi:aspartyl/asparaginyl-tRNA synthetase
MVNYCSKVPKESIVEIVGEVTIPEKPVEGTTQNAEIKVHSFIVISKSAPMLPFQIDDASQLCTNQATEGVAGGDGEPTETKGTVVNQDVRLNNRVIDLRVPTNQAIFRLQSGVCKLYREFMLKNDFVEIHSPKMIGGASEGGSNVFTFKYFG